MDKQPEDIRILIINCGVLNGPDQLHLLATCFAFARLRHYLRLNCPVKVDSTHYLHICYPNLRYICTTEPLAVYPKQLENLLYVPHRNEICPIIPKGVKRVYLSGNFNQLMENKIPDSVIYLQLGLHFNKPLHNFVSSKLVYLILGDYFNQPIKEKMPDSLQYLEFGNYFNQPVNGVLGCNIKILKLGDHFNQDITDCFPPSIKYLQLGRKFNQIIHSHLPSQLEYLVLGYSFNQIIDPLLLPQLRVVNIDNYSNQKLLLQSNVCIYPANYFTNLAIEKRALQYIYYN